MKGSITYRRLGDYIEQRREKNKGFDVPIRGVSKEGFIPPKQQDADVSLYNVFYKNDFVFNPARMELNSIALNEDLEQGICSSLYEIFYIKDTNVLDPLYLNLLIKTDHFTRFCEFVGWGSVREYCRFADISEFYIEVPPIEQQHKVVEYFNAIRTRIANNKQTIAKLEEAAQALYRKMFVDDVDVENLPEGWRMGTLGEYAKVKSGFAFKSDWWQKEGVPVIKIGSINDNSIKRQDCEFVDNSKVDYANDSRAKYGDIVIAMTGATIGKIAINYNHDLYLVNQRVGLFNLGKEPIKKAPFLYFTLLRDYVQNEIISVGGDSAQANVSGNDIEKIKILLPNEKSICDFNKKVEPALQMISTIWNENEKLTELLSLLMVGMGR